MSRESHPSEPSLPDSSEGLSSSIGRLDKSREDFFSSTSEYVKMPVEANTRRMLEDGLSLSYAFRDVAIEVADIDGADDEKIRIIKRLLLDEDQCRVDHLNALAGKIIVRPIILNPGDQRLDEGIEEELMSVNLAEDSERMNGLLNFYADKLVQDISNLKEFTKNAKAAQARSSAIKFGAVAAAVIIGKRIFKPKSRG